MTRAAQSVSPRVLRHPSDKRHARAVATPGLTEDGKPRPVPPYAPIIYEDNSPWYEIPHITIGATMGFDESACLALRRLNKVWGHGGHDIRLVLLGLGQAV